MKKITMDTAFVAGFLKGIIASSVLVLAACGGGGGSSTSPPTNTGNASSSSVSSNSSASSSNNSVSSSASNSSETSSVSSASSTSSSSSSLSSASSSSAASTSSTSSSNSSSSLSSQASLTLAAVNELLRQKMIADAPHVSNSSVVLGSSQTALDITSRVTTMQVAQSVAKTLDLNLSVIWDPRNGSPPQSGDFAITNLYNGGLSCNSASNTCSDGTHTVSMAESLVNYMSQSLDPGFSNSNGINKTLYGRFLQASSFVCAFNQIATLSTLDTDGLPAPGSYSLVFPADTTNNIYQPDANGGCDVSSTLASTAATAMVVSSNSNNFTKQISFVTNSANITIWLKLDNKNGVYNFMQIEDQRPGGRYAVKRTIAYLTGLSSTASSKILLEHINIGSPSADSTNCVNTRQAKGSGEWLCPFEYDRAFIDESANAAYIVSNVGDPGDANGGTGAPSIYVQYTATANPHALIPCTGPKKCASSALAISFTADGQKFPTDTTVYPSAFYDYNGCVDFRTKAITMDGSLSCDVTGQSILINGGASNMIEQTRQLYISDVIATLLANTDAGTTLAFTGASDIYSAIGDGHIFVPK